MSRETTLRQLIFTLTKEVLRKGGEELLRSEMHSLTDHILNTSCIKKLTPLELELTEGSFFGVGQENKDREFTSPRILVFNYSKQTPYSIAEGRQRTHCLKSFSDFEALQQELGYYCDSKMLGTVVSIDGELVDFDLKLTQNPFFGGLADAITWEKDVYSIDYVLEDRDIAEKFKSKHSLENRLKSLVRQGAEEIKVRNLVDDLDMDFQVTGVLHNSTKADDKASWLIWESTPVSGLDEEEEEENIWGNLDEE